MLWTTRLGLKHYLVHCNAAVIWVSKSSASFTFFYITWWFYGIFACLSSSVERSSSCWIQIQQNSSWWLPSECPRNRPPLPEGRQKTRECHSCQIYKQTKEQRTEADHPRSLTFSKPVQSRATAYWKLMKNPALKGGYLQEGFPSGVGGGFWTSKCLNPGNLFPSSLADQTRAGQLFYCRSARKGQENCRIQ